MANGWWNLDGAIASCVAAYQPIGAADYAASKVNLFNPGTYNATDGTAYPSWTSGNGWYFLAASNRYLKTGVIPAVDASWSFIIRFTGNAASDGALFGSINGTSNCITIIPSTISKCSFRNGHRTTAILISPSVNSGVLAMAGSVAYVDGSPVVGTLLSGTGSGLEVYVGGIDKDGSLLLPTTAYVQAFAIYNGTLTAQNIADLTTRMNALPVAADNLTAADFTLSAVTFDAPTLVNVTGTEDLTAVDFTLAPVTFDAPTLVNIWTTPASRTYTIPAESRSLAISTESRTLAIPAESRGLKITSESESKYEIARLTYNGLTGLDFTLARPTFDAAILTPVFNALIVFDGNSMTADAYSSYPATTVSALVGTWTAHNFGVSGQTTIEMIADGVAQIDTLYDTNKLKNVVVFWEVANDLKLGATQADAQARMVQYCQARQAAGFKVVVLTILPRTQVGLPETFEEDRIAINAYIRANYASFADAVADVAGDSRIGDYGDSDDTTYFYDGVHMTTAGYNIVAGIAATTINAL